MATEPPLVTVLGASGFLGSALLRELSTRRVRVRAVARRACAAPDGTEVRAVDLTRPGALAEAVAGSSVVFPFAARIRGSAGWRVAGDDTAADRVNTGLVHDLVSALRGAPGPAPVVVFPGTNTQVGRVAAERIDGTEEDRPEGVYDRQKHAAEQALKAATRAGDLRAVSLRLPPVFGPPAAPTARDRGVVSTMARRALAGEPLTMWHDGSPRRDFLYVADAVRAFATAALDHPDRLAGRHFLLGTGAARPLGEVFHAVARAVSRAAGAAPVPVRSVEPPAHAEGSDFRSIDVDPSAFTAATGWRAVTELDTALTETVAALATED